ncbi:hypothetical protein [Bdellovibrio sp. HCB337]|uniref:hypothetical protein n=1 Tax=Bdellovibrio sp. HCB337 TaxID=3394358 RepID=UPI0039A652A5
MFASCELSVHNKNNMTGFRFLFSLIVFGTPFLAQAQAAKKADQAIPLFFQADKNNIQVLPQRFEYNLIDEDNIKIGDIVIDSTTFGFQIAPSTQFPGKYRARFIWPSGLLKEGSILIKDNTGKAVWTTNVSRRQIRLVNAEPKEGQDKTVRTQLAELVVDQINPVLIEDMKYFPFMNFCISRTNLDTKIYLCSKETYLTSQNNRLTIKARGQGKRPPFVEINGKNVGHQGIIFLNNENENIGFRAMTQSGAVLEVETRMKPVDFKDVVLSEDKKEIILTASGAEPVNEEKVTRISDDEWKFNLDVQRPILYLKGEGDIPMRQEFYIKGNTPADTARPSLDKNSFDRLYKPDVELKGTIAAGTTVSEGDETGRVEKLEGNRFRWRIEKIPAGETSRHYLRVNHEQNSYIAGYDIYRDFPFEAGALASYWTPAGQIYGDLHGTWWIENFVGSSADWSRLHFGLHARESLLLLKKSGEPNMNITHLELIWRSKAGFHFQDKTWGLLLPVEMIQATGVSVTSFGVGYFYSDKPATKKMKKYFDWYDIKFNYLLGGGGDVKLKNAIQLTALAYKHVDKRFSWSYGAGLNQYSFDPGESKMQFQLTGGANYRF